jgi:hypothetical protein
MPWFLGNSHGFGFFIPLMIWSVFWTGLALWHAARREEKWWFILFLFVHTAGILEIIYLIFVAKAIASRKSSIKRRKRS